MAEKGGRGGGKMLTLDDKGRRGGWEMLTLAVKGGSVDPQLTHDRS